MNRKGRRATAARLTIKRALAFALITIAVTAVVHIALGVSQNSPDRGVETPRTEK